MSAFNTCCGFYCSFVSLIGVYFFLVLAIMELRHNPWLTKEKNGYEKKTINGKEVHVP